MNRKWYTLIMLLFVVVATGSSVEAASVVAPGAMVEKLAGQG